MNDIIVENGYKLVFLKNRGAVGLKFHYLKSLDLLALYYQQYYGTAFKDLSFFLMKDSSVVALVLGYKIKNDFCWPLDGIQIHNDDTIPKESQTSIILAYIEKQAKENGCQKIVIKDFLPEGKISLLGEKLFNQKYHAELKFEMNIDYADFDEKKFHTVLRKSYKSLINWGKKNLKIIYVNKDNLSSTAFQSFKDFHLTISGRKTRSDESWEAQYEIIREGFGELILANYQDKLVAGSLFVDSGISTIYFTGVYERELFEFGISHTLLYEGICRSFERGNTSRFSLGHFDTNIQDPKWYNIQFFKKGFCKNLKPEILWSKEFMCE